MRRVILAVFLGLLILAGVVYAQVSKQEAAPAGKTPWHLKATIIEACSCPLFCPCYFNLKPAHHYCQFNNAFNIEQGNLGNVKLDGMKVWLSGDLGGDFTTGKAEWLVFTFEPTATPEQIDAGTKVLGSLYSAFKFPVLGIDKKQITWEIKGNKATAKMGDGSGSIDLVAATGSDGKTPTVINNLPYWSAKSNSGFNLYKSKHHYKGHEKDFTFEDTNGFTIGIETSGEM